MENFEMKPTLAFVVAALALSASGAQAGVTQGTLMCRNSSGTNHSIVISESSVSLADQVTSRYNLVNAGESFSTFFAADVSSVGSQKFIFIPNNLLTGGMNASGAIRIGESLSNSQQFICSKWIAGRSPLGHN